MKETERATPMEQEPSLTATVVGMYTRAPVPRRDELPEDYGLRHVQKDQCFCRTRITDNAARFVPEIGLVDSSGNDPKFFHTDLDEHDDGESDSEDELSDSEDEEDAADESTSEGRIYEERAILIQSIENYENLLRYTEFSKYVQSEHDSKNSTSEGAAATEERSTAISDIINNPCFGEQLLVRGCDTKDLAIGDIFEVQGGGNGRNNSSSSTLKVEITSPRVCCAWVDKRIGSPFGRFKTHCTTKALGGWFARVLVAGELSEGMQLVRTAHPHPKWTLPYIAQTLYGEGPRSYVTIGWAFWNRELEELKELCALPQLGYYEWKDEAEYIVKYWKDYSVMRTNTDDGTKKKTKTRGSLLFTSEAALRKDIRAALKGIRLTLSSHRSAAHGGEGIVELDSSSRQPANASSVSVLALSGHSSSTTLGMIRVVSLLIGLVFCAIVLNTAASRNTAPLISAV